MKHASHNDEASGGRGGPPHDSGGRFGTFAGVFTPSILTILGVVMYLRFGQIVGNAGLGQALLIVVVGHLITVATGLSVSTIATNRTVRAGGAYYIISRSLGAPTGAAIGIPLFLGQALSITFYVVGFVESLAYLVPGLPRELCSAAVCTLLALITMVGADWAIKTQYVVMAMIVASLVSFFSGSASEPVETIVYWNTEGSGFAESFSIFFPAVTGIMAGVGMSGDLKNPRKSLPRGTLLAIGTGFLVYTAVPIWLAYNADSKTLMSDVNIMWSIARFPSLIYAGVWGATLSSAIGSFMTAPRTLQALAQDRLVPHIFARGSGKNHEPRLGTAFTFALALGGIMLGSLDNIAELLTMFFLATYGFTNLACGLERWAANPSFRPDFRVPASVSLAGGIGCFYVMSIMNLPAMLGAFAICGIIWAIVQRRSLHTTWGDARHGIWSALVRTALHQLQRAEFHPQNWRPNLLILGGDVRERMHLLEMGSAMVQDRGIVTYMNLLPGSVPDRAAARVERQQELDQILSQRFPHVFGRVDIVDDIYRGAVAIAQSYGVGSFAANTVMLGWRKNPENFDVYIHMLRDLILLDRSLLLVHDPSGHGFRNYKKIQIWWSGLAQNGGLMLLVAHLITADPRWRRASVELIMVVDSEDEQRDALLKTSDMLSSARLRASARVILRDGQGIRSIMQRESAGTDLAILGMRLPRASAPVKPFFRRMNGLLSELPTTLLVHSARDFRGEPVLFDDDPDLESSSPPVDSPSSDVAPTDAEQNATDPITGLSAGPRFEPPPRVADAKSPPNETLAYESRGFRRGPADTFVGQLRAVDLPLPHTPEPASNTAPPLPRKPAKPTPDEAP